MRTGLAPPAAAGPEAVPVLVAEQPVATGAPARGTGAAGRRRPLKLLVLTTLYPSASRPRHGIFIENRLRRIVAAGGIEARVVAPVPWFPSSRAVFGAYAAMAATPAAELRHGIEVAHPRFPVIPKIGMRLQPHALAWAAARGVESARAVGFEPDLIDAHFFYPDGVAAALLATRYGKPLVVSARGSDINLFGSLPGARRAIVAAAAKASLVIAVSEALRQRMIALGIDDRCIRVLRNGVDLALFRPQPRGEARARLALPAGPLVAAVGNLVPEKGIELVLHSLAACQPAATLLLVGEGPQRAALERLAARLGIAQRLVIRPNMTQQDLSWVYSAADVLALGSTREGWPNVLLESLACGTPVVATDVGGVREIIADPVAGEVVPRREPVEFAAALDRVLARSPRRDQVRVFAARFDWEPVIRAQRDVYFSLVDVA